MDWLAGHTLLPADGWILLLALFSPLLAPYDPAAQNVAARLAAPSLAHPLGQDEFGRDVLSRLLVGARASLRVALVSAVIAGAIGVAIGTALAFAAFAGAFGVFCRARRACCRAFVPANRNLDRLARRADS